MKKVLLVVFGMFFVVCGAFADGVNKVAATTNTVLKSKYDIEYGDAAAASRDTYGYRKGVQPQNSELTVIEGTEVSSTTIDNTPIGNLAAAENSGTGNPLKTIKANQANITVLQNHKLVKPGDGGTCVTERPCGYVTTGSHANDTNNKVWLKIATSADAGVSGN